MTDLPPKSNDYASVSIPVPAERLHELAGKLDPDLSTVHYPSVVGGDTTSGSVSTAETSVQGAVLETLAAVNDPHGMPTPPRGVSQVATRAPQIARFEQSGPRTGYAREIGRRVLGLLPGSLRRP